MNSTSLRRGLPKEDKERFAEVRSKADRLGVLDMSFNGTGAADSLECYERTLGIIEQHKARFDRNAGEAEAQRVGPGRCPSLPRQPRTGLQQLAVVCR